MTQDFLDTAVLIGQVFHHDPWHTCANRCMRMGTRKYISTNVKREFDNRVYEIRTEVQSEVLRLLSALRKRDPNEVPSYNDLSRIVTTPKSRHVSSLLNAVAQEACDNALTISRLAELLRNDLRTYMAESMETESLILNSIADGSVCCWTRRTRLYSDLDGSISSIISNHSDVNILLDAHDLAVEKSLRDLEFVTGDLRDIKRNEGALLQMLSISCIRYLGDFSRNKPGIT